MKIAYIGAAHGTSLHRAKALMRLGHDVAQIDPRSWLPESKWASRWLHHAGGLGVGMLVQNRLIRTVQHARPQLIWVDQGEFLGPRIIRNLKKLRVSIVNYAVDNPYGGRDGMRFRQYLRSVPEYDLLVVVREENVHEAKNLGARNVMRVFFSADEVAHASRKLTEEQSDKFSSDVAFIGTWMPERGPFLLELVERGVPLCIWGNRWQKAPEWRLLKACWKGPGLHEDRDYAAAILASRVCLGLLSKGNHDKHTTRSLEIPSLGGLLCAERTSEHLTLYEEDREAVFWSSAEECAEKCLALLKDEPRRRAIAEAGHLRALKNECFNEKVLATILERAMELPRHG